MVIAPQSRVMRSPLVVRWVKSSLIDRLIVALLFGA